MAKQAKKGTAAIEEAIIVEDHAQEGAVIKIDEAIKNDIAKFDVNKAVITKLKKKYSTLVITGPDDKAGYKAVDEARKDLWRKTTALENKRKEIKADIIKRGKDIDTYAKDVHTLIVSGPGGMDELLVKTKAIDDQIKEEKERLEREAQELLNQRVTDLEAAGIAFDGRFYSVGTISLTIDILKEIPAEGMEILLTNVKNEKFRLDEEKRIADEAEQKRLADIEAQRLENEQKEKDLKEREDRIKAQEEKLITDRNDGRKRTLLGLGLVFDPIGNAFEKRTPSGNVIIPLGNVEAETEEEWGTRFEHTQTAVRELTTEEEKRIKDLEEQEAEKRRIDNRNEVRLANLVGAGFEKDDKILSLKYKHPLTEGQHYVTYSEIFEVPDTGFADFLKSAVSELKEYIAGQDKIVKDEAAAEEKLRVDGLSDAEKIEAYKTEISSIEAPELSTEAGQEYLFQFQQRLMSAFIHLADGINQLK